VRRMRTKFVLMMSIRGEGQHKHTRNGDYSPIPGDKTKSAPGPSGAGADFGKKRKLFSN
jgi:hypothetical protein